MAVGKGDNWGGAEASGDASQGVVLGDSGQLDKVFGGFEGPKGGTICEDW